MLFSFSFPFFQLCVSAVCLVSSTSFGYFSLEVLRNSAGPRLGAATVAPRSVLDIYTDVYIYTYKSEY